MTSNVYDRTSAQVLHGQQAKNPTHRDAQTSAMVTSPALECKYDSGRHACMMFNCAGLSAQLLSGRQVMPEGSSLNT
jgi:hypothetical protein